MSEARVYEPTVTRVKTVRVIPPTIQPLSDIPAFSARPRRVAAYARVSTSSEEQLTSYEAQVKHYTEYGLQTFSIMAQGNSNGIIAVRFPKPLLEVGYCTIQTVERLNTSPL